MHCGQPLVAAPVPMMPQGPVGQAAFGAVGSASMTAFDAQRKRNTAIGVGAGAIALIASALIGARAMGLIRLGDKIGGDDALKLTTSSGPSTIKKVMSQGPPVLQKQEVGMPQDVEDWLNHLKETERRKRILTQRQYTEFSQMPAMMQLGVTSPAQVQQLTDPDSIMDKTPDNQALQDMVSDAKPAWYRLNDFFLSVKAPAECETIAENYSTGLCQIGDTMADIAKIVDSVDPSSANLNSDIQAGKKDVYEIQQTHRETVDQSFKKALYGVDDVCEKYHRKRWFDIDTSGGGSSILGEYMGGGGG